MKWKNKKNVYTRSEVPATPVVAEEPKPVEPVEEPEQETEPVNPMVTEGLAIAIKAKQEFLANNRCVFIGRTVEEVNEFATRPDPNKLFIEFYHFKIFTDKTYTVKIRNLYTVGDNTQKYINILVDESNPYSWYSVNSEDLRVMADNPNYYKENAPKNAHYNDDETYGDLEYEKSKVSIG